MSSQISSSSSIRNLFLHFYKNCEKKPHPSEETNFRIEGVKKAILDGNMSIWREHLKKYELLDENRDYNSELQNFDSYTLFWDVILKKLRRSKVLSSEVTSKNLAPEIHGLGDMELKIILGGISRFSDDYLGGSLRSDFFKNINQAACDSLKKRRALYQKKMQPHALHFEAEVTEEAFLDLTAYLRFHDLESVISETLCSISIIPKGYLTLEKIKRAVLSLNLNVGGILKPDITDNILC